VKQAKVRKNWLIDAEKLKDELLKQFSEWDFRNLTLILGRLGNAHYSKQKPLILGQEKELRNYLLDKGHSPFLLMRIPEEIKFQLKNNMISQKNASAKQFLLRHQTASTIGEKIRVLGLEHSGKVPYQNLLKRLLLKDKEVVCYILFFQRLLH